MAEQTTRPSRPDASMSLLTGLLTETLDPGYAEAAARRAARPPGDPAAGRAVDQSPTGWTQRFSPLILLGVAAIAMVLVVAAIQVQRTAPQVSKERTLLIQRIQTAQATVAAREKSIEALRAELQSDQSAALGPGSEAAQKFDALSVTAGAVAVTGPGAQVVVDDAASSSGAAGGDSRQQTGPDLGRVQDVDLQHVVNGLWASGAEAISINGERLTSQSAIRTAGSAINVDYRPLNPPYTVSAIGDQRTLAGDFAETPDGLYLIGLKSYGIRVDITAKSELSLPAAAQTDVTDARVVR